MLNAFLMLGYYICMHSDVAIEREVEGDLLLGDMGQGMPFRPGTFDGVIRYMCNRNYMTHILYW